MHNENAQNEKLLLKRISKGDIKAFDQFYYEHEWKLKSFSTRLLKDENAAKDIVQQVFVKIWEKRKGLKKIKNVDAYLFTISKNLIYNQMRKKVYEFAFCNYYKETTDHLINSTELEVNFNEINNLVDIAVEKLPPKRKQIFKMSRFYGFSNKEIAKDLNTSTSFVENQINKALKVLKAQIPQNESTGIR